MLYDAKRWDKHTDNSIASVLIRARALIADPKHFSPGGWGHDGRYCAVHAIFEASGMPNVTWDTLPAVNLLTKLCKTPLSHYNDAHSHKQVLALFDRGIAMASAEQKP